MSRSDVTGRGRIARQRSPFGCLAATPCGSQQKNGASPNASNRFTRDTTRDAVASMPTLLSTLALRPVLSGSPAIHAVPLVSRTTLSAAKPPESRRPELGLRDGTVFLCTVSLSMSGQTRESNTAALFGRPHKVRALRPMRPNMRSWASARSSWRQSCSQKPGGAPCILSASRTSKYKSWFPSL